VLVEEPALEHAEAECSADADQRSVRRERAELYRDKHDQVVAMRMAESIRQMFSACPPEEGRAIAAHVRRFAAAAAGVVPPPDQHSRKERYERRWWRPSATGTRNTTAFSCRGLAAWMPGTQFATTLIACSNAGAAFLVSAGTSFFPTLAPWFASTLLSAG